ncbi:hypothetical protein AB0C15_26735 [Micromonospora sp. NPDC048835]|uniref:hypothetical protein n=1 Tax=Micromonospora sp. NPDC048835 TaxID=3155147 RepID=UPI0033C19D26
MAEGLQVDTDEIRAHARTIEALREQFDAIKAASAHISQDDRAYGLLCGWISGILESRHTRQDELIAGVEENLWLVVDGLYRTGEAYDAVEGDTNTMMGTLSNQLGPG